MTVEIKTRMSLFFIILVGGTAFAPTAPGLITQFNGTLSIYLQFNMKIEGRASGQPGAAPLSEQPILCHKVHLR